MGLRKNSKHPASVDGVLFTAQHKAASRAETSGLLLTARKAERWELGRHGRWPRGEGRCVGRRPDWKKGLGIQAVGAHGEDGAAPARTP
jgi:hypothetical protein